MRTSQADETRRRLRAERAELLGRRVRLRFEVASRPNPPTEQWDAVRLRLWQVTVALRHIGWREAAKRRKSLARDLGEAWRRRRLAEAHRLARRLAGTGLGVGNKCYRCAPRYRAEASEWMAYLRRPGREGGLSALEVDFGEEEARLVDGEALPELTLAHLNQAEDDFAAVGRAMAHGRKRRGLRLGPLRWSSI